MKRQWDAGWGGNVALALAIIINVAGQAMKDNPHLVERIGKQMPTFMPSFEHLFAYTPFVLLCIAGFAIGIRKLGFIRLRPLEILSPLDGGTVHNQQEVIGAVSERPMQVQLLVRGHGDHLWHPQPATKLAGRTFSGVCHFGRPEGDPGEYEIVAVDAKKPLTEPIKKLSWLTRRSPIVAVSLAV